MANQKTYSFEGVGETVEEYRQTNRVDDARGEMLPIGIKTPVEFGTDKDGLLVMHYRMADTIKDNLRNLLLTNHGERLGQYDFGANLTELTFELGTDAFDTEAMLRISKAMTKFMPYIKLLEYKPFNEKGESGALARAGFSISYSVPLAKLNNQKIELILYAAG